MRAQGGGEETHEPVSVTQSALASRLVVLLRRNLSNQARDGGSLGGF